MSLKQYTHQPDPGLFDTIKHRLRRRRALRRGGAVVALLAVAGIAWLALAPAKPTAADPADAPMVARTEPAHQFAPEVQPLPSQPAPTVDTAPVASRPASAVTCAEAKPANHSQVVAAANPTALPRQPQSASTPQDGPAAPASAAVPVAETAPTQLAAAEADLRPDAQPQASVPSAEIPAPKSETESTDVMVWAPNVIVPDGDVEDNRTFSLRFTSEVSHYKLYIFNRNGRQLAYSTDPAYQWDATYNGTRLPQGTYVWVVQLRDGEGRPVQKKGTVTVLR